MATRPRKKFDTITLFDRIHEREGRTVGRTPYNGTGRAYASHRAAKIVTRKKKIQRQFCNSASLTLTVYKRYMKLLMSMRKK